MKKGGKPLYLRIRRIVDSDLRDNHKPWSISVGFLISIPGVYLLSENNNSLIGLVICAFGAVAELFVLWRAVRMLKAANRYAARRYERTDRYFLPPEYADSESAYLAARRRAIRRPR